MVNALNNVVTSSEGVVLHQLLHGYSDGHRLIESSFLPQDDLARLILRLSDLSGSSVVSGFEEYLTGYPLPLIDSFALARTWPAPEMPRPGCVWTHTIVVSNSDLAKIENLWVLSKLFLRPRSSQKGEYAKPIEFRFSPTNFLTSDFPELKEAKIRLILKSFYENPNGGLLIPTQTAKDVEREIFAIWSQQWPSLRASFTFCTGSLSSRNYGDRPFDVQCVPQHLLHQVISDFSPAVQRPIILDSRTDLNPETWSGLAAKDAYIESGGSLRDFLLRTTESSTGRKDFIALVEIYQSLEGSQPITNAIKLVSKTFPMKFEGVSIKQLLFGPDQQRLYSFKVSEYDVLYSLGTTEFHESFDAENLCLHQRGQNFPKENPDKSRKLLADLFKSENQLGELILAGLISGLDPVTARYITEEQPHFLPALFRANPSLACFPELWEAAGENRWELLESLTSYDDLGADLVARVMGAILTSNPDDFELIRRAVLKWGKPAIFGALDWIDSHHGKLSDACRRALTYEDRIVAAWVDQNKPRSLTAVIAAAHIVAPYSYKLFDNDTSSWRAAFHKLRSEPDNLESIYFATFLLALAFGNSPPDALGLVAETFEIVHNFFESAHKYPKYNYIAHESWIIMDPLLPHLSFVFEWDKCERLRRGLVEAFIKHQWPATGLNKTIQDLDVFLAIFKSARRINGGLYYFRELEKTRR